MEKGLISVYSPQLLLHHWGKSRQQVKPGTCRQKMKLKPQTSAPNWLACRGLFSLFCFIPKTTFSRVAQHEPFHIIQHSKEYTPDLPPGRLREAFTQLKLLWSDDCNLCQADRNQHPGPWAEVWKSRHCISVRQEQYKPSHRNVTRMQQLNTPPQKK